MVYIGNAPSTSFATVVKDTFNGGDTSGASSVSVYTLSKVATTNSVSVFVENVRQEPTTAYSVSGTTLTFTATTPSGTGNIYVLHMNPTTTTTHPAAQNLTAVDGTFTGTVTAGSTLDMNGTELILDADADTSITADTDDRIDFKTGGTDRLQIQSTSGNNVVIADGLTLTDGNLIVASGHGIDFSATSDTSATNASDTSELLDEYEEGTWTPVVADANSGGNTGSYSSGGSAGNRYIKVGRLVYITCELFNINTSGMTGGNVLFIRGLPFSGHSSGTYNVGAVHINDVDYNAGGAYYTFMDNSAFMRVYEVGTTGSGHNSVKIEDLNSGASDIVCTLMYFSS